jgi:hypothetical protein
MFTLGGDSFPRSQAEFETALNDGMKLFGPCPGIAEIRGTAYPDLERLALDLSGGRISSSLRDNCGSGGTSAGVRVQSFSIKADPLHLPEAEAALSVEARNVALDFDRSESGSPVLELTFAEHGTIELSLAKSNLESLIGALAKKAAAKKEVEIERTEVEFTSESPKALRFRAKVTARKMIFSVEIAFTGRFEIDESLDARLTDLDCSGEGIIGAGACEMIRPHLAKAEGRTISLAALPLGRAKLHDLRMHVGDPVRIEAVFGKA